MTDDLTAKQEDTILESEMEQLKEARQLPDILISKKSKPENPFLRIFYVIINNNQLAIYDQDHISRKGIK